MIRPFLYCPAVLAAILALSLPTDTRSQTTPTSSAQSQAADLEPDLTFIVDGGPDGPIEAGAWLPVPSIDGRPAALIVISHGHRGGYQGHADTARALAQAGFVVAALTHPGDNYRDMSRSIQMTGRAPQLSRLIDHVTSAAFRSDAAPVTIDSSRIGAFGFSAGGFTVTSAIGGESDAAVIQDHCIIRPDDFACRLLAVQPINATTWRPEARDGRIKAAVIAAPALGFSFTSDSLAAIHVPVQLWKAEHDEILPAPYNVEPIRDRLPTPPEYHLTQGAGHYDFLRPCMLHPSEAVPDICTPTPGFDRTAFHQDFNREVVRFFQDNL